MQKVVKSLQSKAFKNLFRLAKKMEKKVEKLCFEKVVKNLEVKSVKCQKIVDKQLAIGCQRKFLKQGQFNAKKK